VAEDLGNRTQVRKVAGSTWARFNLFFVVF